MLAVAGAAGGLLLGWWTARLFTTSLVAIMPLPIQFDPRPDVNIMLVTTIAACVSALAFGLAPALKISRPDVVDDLKDTGASRDSGRRFGTRTWLVVAQVAVSLVLITAGALFARAALKADVDDPGYRYDGLLLASVDPGLASIDAGTSHERMQSVVDRLRAIPGVAAVGVNSQVPFGDYHQSTSVERIGRRDQGRREPTYTLVRADYFAAVGLPILRGRGFAPGEEVTRTPPRVAIIDEPLARRLFDDEDPVGQQLLIQSRAARRSGSGTDSVTIVGVVRGIRDELTEREPAAHLYMPWTPDARNTMHFHVRATDRANAAALLPQIRARAAGGRRSPSDGRTPDDAGLPRSRAGAVGDPLGRPCVVGPWRAGGAAGCVGVYGVKS